MAAIDIRNFAKSYGEITAVRDLTLQVEHGELFGLIGPDGAGKTTTMRTVCTLLSCESGQMSVAGHDVRENIAEIRSILGYMPQRFSLYPDLTVKQNLNFFADLFRVPKAAKKTRLAQLYHFNQLKPFESRLASALSGGMKQKLALSCTLIHKPQILILDEPTTGVDPVSRREFWEILRQLKQEGVTIVVSTPYMDEADLCDRVAFLHNGRLMALDSPTQLAKYFDEALYEIVSVQPRILVKFFQEQTPATSVRVQGDTLHVTFANTLTTSEAERIMPQSPITIQSYKQINPSTEDTFLRLMMKQEAAS